MKTLCLSMIVKNEAKIIEECFDSVIDYIDYWVICDTGSTDGTQDIIRKYFSNKKIKGDLHQMEWKNFGYNRTLSMEKSYKKADYILLLDADFRLKVLNKSFKETIGNGDNYLIRYAGNLNYRNLKLVDGNVKWKYVGVTHEYITSDEKFNKINNDDIQIVDCAQGSNRAVKFERDSKLLLKGIVDEPTNVRYFFYLANTYYEHGDNEIAMKYYKKRVEMGGWVEEVYYSMYRYAMAKMKNESMEAAVYDFLKAHNYRPSRLEALYEVVKYYRTADPKKGYAYGMLGYGNNITYPTDLLFVDDAIHKYKFIDELAICAYYAEQHAFAIALNDELIKMYTNGEKKIDIERIYKNKELSTNITTPKSKTVCIYTGYSSISYSGKNHIEKKVGGSELAAINIAEQLSSSFNVYFCGYNIENECHNNVFYNNEKKMRELLENEQIDILIISRYIHCFTEFKITAKKVFLWLHDIHPLPWLTGGKFHNYGYDLLYNVRDSVDGIVCLSDWHKELIMGDSKLPEDKFHIIGNGFNDSDFGGKVERIKNRFVYISDWYRSLKDILDIFPDIISQLPDAELHVFCDDIPKDMIENVQSMPYVVLHGRIPHTKVIEELEKADAWIHIPSQFCETYCISALEAQRAGCICFISDVGCLVNTVGERGVVLRGDNNRANVIVNTLKDEALVKKKRQMMKEWSIKQTWAGRAEKWKDIFGGYKKYIKIINLERRGDARIEMKKLLGENKIEGYEFIKACDGMKLMATPKLKNLFRDNDFKNQR